MRPLPFNKKGNTMIIKSKQILINKLDQLNSNQFEIMIKNGITEECSEITSSIAVRCLQYMPNKVLKKWIKEFEKEK